MRAIVVGLVLFTGEVVLASPRVGYFPSAWRSFDEMFSPHGSYSSARRTRERIAQTTAAFGGDDFGFGRDEVEKFGLDRDR